MVKLDGETVKETMPVLGYLHRSIEKICENRTYPQCITYTDRVDYVSAMSVNLAFALATERLMGIQIPPRAQWLRMIFVELQRLASHLLWMGAFAGDIGALTPFLVRLEGEGEDPRPFRDDLRSAPDLQLHPYRRGHDRHPARFCP